MNDPRLQAEGLAQFGRYGDSMLMHVNPEEVQGLQSLAQANGTSLTTNPYTGQPESFNMKKFIKMAAPVAAGFAFGPAAGTMMGGMSATAGGIAAGALTGAGIAAFSNENILQGALFGGLGGMGGAGLRGAAGAVGAGAGDIAKANAGTLATENAAAAQFARNPLTPQTFLPGGGNVATNVLNAPMSGANRVVQGSQFDAYMKANPGNFRPPPTTTTTDALKTIGSSPTAVAKQWGGGNALAGYGKAGMTLGMPVLAGMEPPGGVSEGEFEPPYDPYSQLDLSGDTGLRLVSNGGLISLANGGNVDFGEGEGDFVAGNFAAGDFAEGDNFGEFAEVTEAGQFNDFNQFNDFANDPLLQEPGFNDPLLQEPGFNAAVNQPLPPAQNNFNAAVNQPLPPAQNNLNNPPATGRFIAGAGDGLSDSIPASIEGEQEARLSDGEFVVPADVVSGIGNGSSDAGSAQLFDMMNKIRKRRTGKTGQPEAIRPGDLAVI